MLSNEEVLLKAWRGVLGLVDGDKPYCIPVAFIYKDGFLYFLFPKEGRKTKCIEKNKNACYLIHDLNYSVLIEGQLERVKNTEEIESVLKDFYEKVFPRDPYFKRFNERFILEVCLSDSKAGLYKLIPKTISGFKD